MTPARSTWTPEAVRGVRSSGRWPGAGVRWTVAFGLTLLALGPGCAQLTGLQPGELGQAGISGASPSTGGATGGAAAVGEGPSSGGSSASRGGSGAGGANLASSGGTAGMATAGRASGGATQGPTMKVDLTGKKVLLIVDDPAALDDGDQMLSDLMTSRGMIVKVGAATPADSTAAAQDLIVGSSGASGSDLAASYQSLPVPILTFGNPYYQPLDFIASSSAKGSVPGTTRLTVVDAASSLAASFASGTNLDVISPTRSTQISWATPGGAATAVASVMGSPTELCVFAYEKGAMMVKSVAPGRRASLCWKTDAIPDLAIDSYRLMVAAIEWSAGAPP
jgi:hypothetical protein